MKKGHIAFFTNETKAHTYSTFALASVLMKRGYHVSYATTEYLAPAITQLGAEAAIYKSLELHKQPTPSFIDELEPHDPRNWDLIMKVVVPFGISTGINVLTQLAGFYNQNPPDLIIYDPDAYAGRFLAAAKGIRAIQISCYLAFYNNFYSRENSPWPVPLPTNDIYDQLNLFYSLAFPAEKLNIFTIPKAFQANADSLDERFFFSGPCVQEQEAATHQSRLDKKERPIILVSRSASNARMGSDYSYFKSIAEALSDMDFNVILSIDDSMDPEKLMPLPENSQAIQKVPQREIISKASIFIGSGGTVSTFEALQHGIPVILIPQDIFHAEFSYYVAKLGLGIVIKNSEINENSIKEAITQASTSPHIQRNVREMQKSIRDSDAANSIAEKIEKYLNQK